ncbi:alkaline phosphatase family protein [Paenibacillus aestuarii]|uniref:Alkaline phosphatase family protein n=1 Tax=Paenibacillus aestuarii TaxID=516965 RepID=A0ABW0KGE9_9BACL|nr:alkaline phosphatase family protein [Paenibacillus aestuarii]
MKKSIWIATTLTLLLTACSQTNSEITSLSMPANQEYPVATDIPKVTQQPANNETVPVQKQPSAPINTIAIPQLTTMPHPGFPKADHVVIVVEENHSYEKIIGNKSAPYMNLLAEQGAFFTQSYANTHPSEPNYLILFSGSDQGVKDDSCGHIFKTDNLASELLKAHLTFSGFSEDLPSIGSTACSYRQYGRKHSPWVNFSNVPTYLNMPLSSFPTDDFNKLPTVSFVIPNMDNDMHDGTIQTADNWLKLHIEPYVQWAKDHNSLVILTWDEDDSSKNNHIPTIFVGPMVKAGHYDQHITHLNVLRTLEDMYNIPYSGKAASVQPITGIWS